MACPSRFILLRARAEEFKKDKIGEGKILLLFRTLAQATKAYEEGLALNPCSWVEFRSLQERKRSFQQYPWMKQM